MVSFPQSSPTNFLFFLCREEDEIAAQNAINEVINSPPPNKVLLDSHQDLSLVKYL